MEVVYEYCRTGGRGEVASFILYHHVSRTSNADLQFSFFWSMEGSIQNMTVKTNIMAMVGRRSPDLDKMRGRNM